MISRTDGRTCRSNGRARMITAILTTFAGVLLSPVGALAAPSAPASAPQQATWSIERTPNPRVANGTLLAISCPTAHDCVGVGSYDDSAGDVALGGDLERKVLEGRSGGEPQRVHSYRARRHLVCHELFLHGGWSFHRCLRRAGHACRDLERKVVGAPVATEPTKCKNEPAGGRVVRIAPVVRRGRDLHPVP